jgi:hypothetical protein
VIGLLLVIQMPHTGDKWVVTLAPRPIDCFSLRPKGSEGVVGMVFDDIVIDVSSLGASLGTSLNVYVRHIFLL